MARESMIYEYKTQKYVKDLKYLNRDLKRVIVIEKNPETLKYQMDNGIFLSEFKGQKEDRTLYELLPFLERNIILLITL